MSSKLEVFIEDKSTVSIRATSPSRISLHVAPVDDSADFVIPEKTSVGIDRESAVDWYRARCFAYATTRFTAVENILETSQHNPSEKLEVNFDGCGYTNLHVQIALDALLTRIRPTCLTALHLSRNRLFDVSLIRFLGNVLQELQTISYLSVSFNTLGDECVGIMSDALSNSGVRWFEADHCHITDKGGSLLFAALAYSDCIERIQLRWNHLGLASGVTIGKFLSNQRSLVQLDLCGNHLHSETQSVVPVLLGLIGNEMLEDLDLSWNGLRGDAVGRALLKAIPQSKLQRLTLQHNLLGPEEMLFVARALKKSETLLELRLGGNVFDEETSNELVRVAGRHTALVVLSFGRFHLVAARTAKLCDFFSRKSSTKRFIYQGVLLANPPRPVDVQKMLLERCRFLAMKPKKPKLRRDMGHLMLQFRGLENQTIPRVEVLLAVKQFRVKLDRSLVDALMDAFAVSKGSVDVGAMADKYLTLYPTDPPTLPNRTKGKSNKTK